MKQLDLIAAPDDFRLIGNDHQTQLEAEALAVPRDTHKDKAPFEVIEGPAAIHLVSNGMVHYNVKLTDGKDQFRQVYLDETKQACEMLNSQPRTMDPASLALALVALEKVTGEYNPHNWRLAGDRNATTRQSLLELLTGTRPPKAKAGATALAKAFFDAAPSFEPTCYRNAETVYHLWAKIWLLTYDPKED